MTFWCESKNSEQVLYNFVSFYCNWNFLQRFFYLKEFRIMAKSRLDARGESRKTKHVLEFSPDIWGLFTSNPFNQLFLLQVCHQNNWRWELRSVFLWCSISLTSEKCADSTTIVAALNTVAVNSIKYNWYKIYLCINLY